MKDDVDELMRRVSETHMVDHRVFERLVDTIEAMLPRGMTVLFEAEDQTYYHAAEVRRCLR